MKILAIETSCDETGVSILEIKKTKQGQVFKVLANALSSQVKIHAPYGGVYPMLAKREHIKNLPILLEKVLKGSGIFREGSIARAGDPSIAIRQQANMRVESGENPGLDLIAVSSGPGLEPALWTGISFAEKLARKWNVPVIPVNHMEGHIFSVRGQHMAFRDAGRHLGYSMGEVTEILSKIDSGDEDKLRKKYGELFRI